MGGVVGDRLGKASKNSKRYYQAGSREFSLPRGSRQREREVKSPSAKRVPRKTSVQPIQDLLQARDAAQYWVVEKTILR
jgi:hypothetical protein